MAKVLIIDDSSFMRTYLRGYLEAAGHEVNDFLPGSALEVIERIKTWRPDLVLSDFNMPNVDGIAVARSSRRIAPEVPVVIVTANRDPAKEAVLGTIGVRRILYKPLKGEDLLVAVAEVLAQR
jgi:CheY-like chemotaxis protein